MSQACEYVKIVLRENEETATYPKALLVKHSEYFRAMLEKGHFKEGTDGQAITIGETWLDGETFRHLPALLALSDIQSPSAPLDVHVGGLCAAFCTLGNPSGPFALLKMCD